MPFDEFVFGDAEPEDSWDAGDLVEVQIANLFRRLDLLDGHDEPAGRYRPLLQEIEHRLRPWRERRGLNEREQTRVAQLIEDLEFLQERDQRGDYEQKDYG